MHLGTRDILLQLQPWVGKEKFCMGKGSCSSEAPRDGSKFKYFILTGPNFEFVCGGTNPGLCSVNFFNFISVFRKHLFIIVIQLSRRLLPPSNTVALLGLVSLSGAQIFFSNHWQAA